MQHLLDPYNFIWCFRNWESNPTKSVMLSKPLKLHLSSTGLSALSVKERFDQEMVSGCRTWVYAKSEGLLTPSRVGRPFREILTSGEAGQSAAKWNKCLILHLLFSYCCLAVFMCWWSSAHSVCVSCFHVFPRLLSVITVRMTGDGNFLILFLEGKRIYWILQWITMQWSLLWFFDQFYDSQ